MYYSNLIIAEFEKRGYKIKSFDNYNTYFNGVQAPDYIAPYELFNGKMDDTYLRQNFFNLEEKFFCGGISILEWLKIYNKIGYKFDL